MPNRKNAEENAPEQEVLQRRLLREQAAAAGQAAQQVQRQREHLERDEHRQQVVGRREQQHAADREHHQRVDLGLQHRCRTSRARSASLPGSVDAGGANGASPGLEPPLGEQQHAMAAKHEDRALQEQRRAVDGDRAFGGDALRCRPAARPATNAAARGRASASTTWSDVARRRAARRPRPGRRPPPRRGRSASARAAAYVDLRAVGDADSRAASAWPSLGSVGGRTATSGSGSVTPTSVERRARRRVDHVEHAASGRSRAR